MTMSNSDRAKTMFLNMVEAITKFYIDGALDWIEKNEPERSKELDKLMKDIDDGWVAFEKGEISRELFNGALSRYFKKLRSAVAVYGGRTGKVE